MTITGLLLSGGMDSVALAYWKRPEHAFTIDYGQLAAVGEFQAARVVCEELGIQHHELTVDCRSLGSGDMAGTSAYGDAPASDWWPYRNQLLITLAAMRAIALGVNVLAIGTVKTDSTHLDGHPEFVVRLDALMAFQEGQMRIEAPAIRLTTAELVQAAQIPASLLAWSHSCHVSDIACGRCRGCNKHREVMQEIGHHVY